MIPLGDDEADKNDDDDERARRRSWWGFCQQCACVARHFDEAMKQPARHTNDDGSRTTSRALVGSETPKKKKKKTAGRRWKWAQPRTEAAATCDLTQPVANRRIPASGGRPNSEDTRGRTRVPHSTKSTGQPRRDRRQKGRICRLQRLLRAPSTRTAPRAVVLPMLASNIAPT